jgi:hypothetical protein
VTGSPKDTSKKARRPINTLRRHHRNRGDQLANGKSQKDAESRVAVVERLLLKPVDTVKEGQAEKMPALKAIMYQLLQKSLSGDKKAARALQKFEEFARRNSTAEFDIIFVDNEYTKAFAKKGNGDNV